MLVILDRVKFFGRGFDSRHLHFDHNVSCGQSGDAKIEPTVRLDFVFELSNYESEKEQNQDT